MNEYRLRKATQDAIAREIAKRIEVTPDMLATREALEKAQEEWRITVQKAAPTTLERGY